MKEVIEGKPSEKSSKEKYDLHVELTHTWDEIKVCSVTRDDRRNKCFQELAKGLERGGDFTKNCDIISAMLKVRALIAYNRLIGYAPYSFCCKSGRTN